MSDEKFQSLVDKTKRHGGEGKEPIAQAVPQPGHTPDGAEVDSFSVISADRAQKVMCEFRMKTGDAVALAYSYLVRASFDRSGVIEIDFSAHRVRLSGRNLAPVFAGLVAQRVAVVTEMDELQAEAVLSADATVVTGIEMNEVD